MNKKKMTILGTAFVVAVVALAGVGYAAATVAYNGTTTSTTNTTNNAYVTVGLGEQQYTEAFNATIYYDTSNAAGTITYTPTNLTDGMIKVGTITISYNTVNGKANDTFKLNVAATAGSYDETANSWSYKVNDGNAAAMTMAGTDILTGINQGVSNTAKFDLYYTPRAGTSVPSAALTGVTFTVTLASEYSAP